MSVLAMMALLAFPAGATSLPADEAISPERLEAWRATCTHYENRARYKSREQRVEFVTVVADGCAAALDAFSAPGATGAPRQQAAAARFLDRLSAARAAIAEINAGRLAEAATRRAADRSFTRFQRDLARDLRFVRPFGEYLILRAEGVYAALDAWVDAGADFALIAALPRQDG